MHLTADQMTADERFREIASIFAAGILQLRARAAIPPSVTQNPSENAQNPLDLVLDSLLSVHTG